MLNRLIRTRYISVASNEIENRTLRINFDEKRNRGPAGLSKETKTRSVI